MRILLGVGFAFRIAFVCLLGGFALGLYVGVRATGGELHPTDGAGRSGSSATSALLLPDSGREELQWIRTPSL